MASDGTDTVGGAHPREPVAPVFVADGTKAVTMRGANLAAKSQAVVEYYVKIPPRARACASSIGTRGQ